MADKRADERGQPILPISPPVCHRPQPAGHSPDSLPANTLISTQSNTAATNLATRLSRAIYPAPCCKGWCGRRRLKLFTFAALILRKS